MPTNSPDYRSKNWWENYKKYQWGKSEIKKRSSRNKARRGAIKSWRIWKNSKKEIDHKDWNPMNNGKKNLRVISRKTNRTLWAAKANKKKKTDLFYV